MSLVTRHSLGILLGGLSLFTSVRGGDLFDGFAPGWDGQWREQRLFTHPTRYDVAMVDDRPVLHAISDSANAGLVRRVDIAPLVAGTKLGWQWKIAAPLRHNRSERERAGDDYAARVCIIFRHSWFPLRTRAIQYVWAAHEPVGAVFPSPYSSNVGMFVIRSGSRHARQWMSEERDPVADYERFFGTRPERIDAIAVMVDTDNTRSRAEAWFAQLRITSPQATR